jgi:hypothetical protein
LDQFPRWNYRPYFCGDIYCYSCLSADEGWPGMTFSPKAIEAAVITPQRKADLKWPEKARARRLVRDAIKRGHLSRPSECSRCGGNPGQRSDGRSLIHAHHSKGYDNPLDVEWLCVSCHAKEDDRVNGAANGQSVLDNQKVKNILADLAAGATVRGTARNYGVHFRTIHRIRSGECWAKSLAAASDGDKRQ